MSDLRPESSGSEVSAKSGRQRFPRTRRITGSREIRALLQRGKRSRTAHLDVFDSASPFAYPRIGVVVPRHRRSAVDRNRLKRRLREVLRAEVLPRLRESAAASNVLVRARKEAYLATFSQLRDELIAWAEQKWSRNS